MRIVVKTTNLTLTPSLATFLDERMHAIAKLVARMEARSRDAAFGDRGVVARVELARTTRHHRKGDVFRAEITLDLPSKKILRTEAEGDDLYRAIVEARDELRREIRSFKEKRSTLVRVGGRELKRRIKPA
jgi:ribosomal subunit interface protein